MEEKKEDVQPQKLQGQLMFEMYKPYMCRIKGRDAKKGKDYEASERYRDQDKIAEYGYNWRTEQHMCPEGDNQCNFVKGYEGRDGMPFCRFRHQVNEDHVDFWCYDVQALVEYLKKVKDEPRYRETGPQLPGIKRPVFLTRFQLTRLARVYNDFVQGRGNNILSRNFGGTTIEDLTAVSVTDMKNGSQDHEIKRYYVKLDIIAIIYHVGYKLPMPENLAVAIVKNFKSSADSEEDYQDAKMNDLIKKLHIYNNHIMKYYDPKIDCDVMGSMLYHILFLKQNMTTQMLETMLMPCKYKHKKPPTRDSHEVMFGGGSMDDSFLYGLLIGIFSSLH